MHDISKVDKNFVVETDLKETDIVFYDVKENDVIEISFGQRTTKVRVVCIKEFVAKSDASAMYEVLE